MERALALGSLLRAEVDSSKGRIRLDGEVDMSNAPLLQDLLLAETRRSSDVTLDISALRFFDISGAHALVGAADQASGSLSVEGAHPLVLKVLILTKTDRHPRIRLGSGTRRSD
jgi:anti-anti-sigma factor